MLPPTFSVIAVVRADISIAGKLYKTEAQFNCVRVPESVKVAVSWAKGKLVRDGEPLDVSAQAFVSHPNKAPVTFQYTVFAAVNVIPLFPLQSPILVPETGAAAPAIVMSRKSTSVSDATAAAVIVRAVPIVSDRTKCRIVALVPADRVKVPVTV